MIFHPPKSTYQDGPEIIKLSAGGNRISAIHLVNPKAKYTFLVSHGNAEDLGVLLPFLQALYAQGFSVLSYDYQGYGTSEGSPTESNTYADVQAAYKYLIEKKKVPAKQIIVFGRSLGSGPSIELAAKLPVGGLILEAPFLTTFRVITRIPLFVIDKYRNNDKIPHVKVPVLIMHGTRDEVIPFQHGAALAKLSRMKTDFYPIQDAHHNDVLLIAGDAYWEMIHNYILSLN